MHSKKIYDQIYEIYDFLDRNGVCIKSDIRSFKDISILNNLEIVQISWRPHGSQNVMRDIQRKVADDHLTEIYDSLAMNPIYKQIFQERSVKFDKFIKNLERARTFTNCVPEKINIVLKTDNVEVYEKLLEYIQEDQPQVILHSNNRRIVSKTLKNEYTEMIEKLKKVSDTVIELKDECYDIVYQDECCINCEISEGNKFYDLLLSSGILHETFPEWYKYGRF